MIHPSEQNCEIVLRHSQLC